MKKILLIGAIFSFVPAALWAQTQISCFGGRVKGSIPAGVSTNGSSDTDCRYGWFSAADYAVYHYNLYKEASAQSPRSLVQAKISGILSNPENKNVTVLSQGSHAGNPLTDYIAVVKYNREVRVGHDLRIYYYKMVLYSFGSTGTTPYYAQLYIQNELGNKTDTLFSNESSKFYSFINSLTVHLLLDPKNIKVLPKDVRVPKIGNK